MEKRTGLFSNGIIWFGVAISVSEIEAGIEIGAASAPGSLWLPLILGHVLGGILLFFVGLIGARVRLNAMETTSSTFGKYGSKFFAALNVFQLLAWVAVLNAQGASALAGLNLPISFPLTCVILAVLIAIWVFVGLKRSANVTTVVMAALAILLAVLTVKLFGVGATGALASGTTVAGVAAGAAAGSAAGIAATSAALLGFWNIFEISIAMPISWLPVISDYTKDVENPVKATAVSAAAYTFASLWMYIIGIEIAGIGANNNIAQAILLAGLGIPRILQGYLRQDQSEGCGRCREPFKCRSRHLGNHGTLHQLLVFDCLGVRAHGCRSARLVLFREGWRSRCPREQRTRRISRILALEPFLLACGLCRVPGGRTPRFRTARPHAPRRYRICRLRLWPRAVRVAPHPIIISNF